MWIKNLVTFVAEEPFNFSLADLHELLDQSRCPPCGSQTVKTEGFVPPLSGQEPMAYAADQFICITHQEITRMLPGTVIKEELDEKLQHIQLEEGRKVSAKEKAEIKEQVVFDLLPRAFTRSTRTMVILDMDRNRVMVDASSGGRAETVVSCLRKALGSLPVTYPAVDLSPSSSFTNWLRTTALLPEGYTLGDRCDLKSTQDDGSAVKFTAVDLSQEEILAHLETGMVSTRLNLAWKDDIELDLNEKLEIKRIKALDVMKENIESMDAADAVEELQAQISLQGGVLREALDSLYGYFSHQEP